MNQQPPCNPTGIRLAGIGSTRYADPRAYPHAADLVRAAIRQLVPDLLISGGAEGGDSIFEQAGAEFGYTRANGLFIAHLPQNRRWKPDGYQARNLLIAGDCTHLIAARCHTSRTYGSGWTADYAEQNGRVVRRYVWLSAAGRFVLSGSSASPLSSGGGASCCSGSSR